MLERGPHKRVVDGDQRLVRMGARSFGCSGDVGHAQRRIRRCLDKNQRKILRLSNCFDQTLCIPGRNGNTLDAKRFQKLVNQMMCTSIERCRENK